MEDIKFVQRSASVDEFIAMRQSVGWRYPDSMIITTGLKNTIFSVCAEKDQKIIGYGRVVGDGALILYIQDILVRPEYQNMGIGKGIVNEIMKYIKTNYPSGVMVGLMAVKGKEEFYKKLGFIERPNENYGAGMIQYI